MVTVLLMPCRNPALIWTCGLLTIMSCHGFVPCNAVTVPLIVNPLDVAAKTGVLPPAPPLPPPDVTHGLVPCRTVTEGRDVSVKFGTLLTTFTGQALATVGANGVPWLSVTVQEPDCVAATVPVTVTVLLIP